jgi:amino acid transporter
MDSLMLKMENAMYSKVDADRKMWFSMWFLGAIVTFGLAFFPMFYRLIEGRNRHFRREAELEKQVAAYLKSKGKEPPATSEGVAERNAKAWAVSIVLIVPVFVILYLLSRDLAVHERNQDAFLAAAFPQKMFMPQTIPIKTYVLITIVTLGVGVVYWLYKVVNLYNAHFKAQLQVEKEISRLMEEEKAVEQV